ncbi:hypothetical protein RHMOL_Rhmol08G0029200 [Rhododendron molle]|uniref:Uncharacterized protein n=1 Tax=Rhododendron molle TaxID=49168 RepID=A0ACC0MJF5_RHOML|nr:hypothetical protein RHMOL_Rhmol08G0029200 [Rhododendron molle]
MDKEKNSYMEAGSVAGTLDYIAPKCFLTGEATKQPDVYVVACDLEQGSMSSTSMMTGSGPCTVAPRPDIN